LSFPGLIETQDINKLRSTTRWVICNSWVEWDPEQMSFWKQCSNEGKRKRKKVYRAMHCLTGTFQICVCMHILGKPR
jgi:hypothetical protein